MRVTGRAKIVAAVLMAAGLSHAAGTARAEEIIEGEARVVDGDTFVIAGARIRIYGIDAPDIRQTCRWKLKTVRCGVLAGDGLKDLTFGATVRCLARSRRADGTVVATCSAEGRDIGRNMVHTGWALADVGQSARYRPVEDKARLAKRGLWRGPFVKPWDWTAD